MCLFHSWNTFSENKRGQSVYSAVSCILINFKINYYSKNIILLNELILYVKIVFDKFYQFVEITKVDEADKMPIHATKNLCQTNFSLQTYST